MDQVSEGEVVTEVRGTLIRSAPTGQTIRTECEKQESR